MRPLSAQRWLALWKRRLGIPQPVYLEKISIWQVVREDGRPGCSLVGIIFSESEARLYHTRRLTEEDIVHELLHIAHPGWSETEIVAETSRLLTPRPFVRPPPVLMPAPAPCQPGTGTPPPRKWRRGVHPDG